MKKFIVLLLLISAVLFVRDAGASYQCLFRTTNQEEYASWAASGAANANTASRAAITYAQIGAQNGAGTWSGLGENSFSLYDPVPKVGMAYLMANLARTDTWTGWHPASQYGPLSGREGSVFHKFIQWKYLDSNRDAAKTNFNTLVYGAMISFECPSVDNSDSVNRAGLMLHENWHAFWNNHGINPSHRLANSDGSCRNTTGAAQPGGICDFYYPHRQSDYLPSGPAQGSLAYYETGSTTRAHSPTQIAVEYYCDTSQFPQPWVPLASTIIAKGDGADLDGFINVVAWKCGKPIPF